MTDEVYQLRVNDYPIKLGKGSDADDEFASIKEVELSTIGGFMYLPVEVQKQSVVLILPVTKNFKNNWQSALQALGATSTSPWPIISVCAYQDKPIPTNIKYYGLVSPLKILIQVDNIVSEVSYTQIGAQRFM